MADYNPASFEPKWQRRWEEEACFEAADLPSRPHFYCLEMLPYPSGRIHMGHVRNYAIGDAVARFKRMRGFEVMHPMGWDSFGMPAENAAIKQGLHPRAWTDANIADMRGQLKKMGFAYDWSREIASHLPEYYRWNQWFFIRMYEKGLAYRSLRRVNWCPECATVLANEQVEQGGCWRCGSVVGQKDLDQWFLRITRYAQELLDDLDGMAGWPEKVLTMQRNWIGRSEGAWVDFKVEGMSALAPIRVFTTRVDTIFGATFLALSPVHPAVEALIHDSREERAARQFIENEKPGPSGGKNAVEREKTGIFTGRYATNPFNGERIPIWLANFVLIDYGTGALMAVPAHDERDHEFALRYKLPIRRVIEPAPAQGAQAKEAALPFTAIEGRVVDSGRWSGMTCHEARSAMAALAASEGFGEPTVQFRLRDWGISRQRYWGTPIPMVHCEACGVVPAADTDLPVLLPDDVSFTGTGGSPLASSPTFVTTACPRCQEPARRDTDTMDTFMDSSWYFYRYLDPKNTQAPFRPEVARAWFPIDLYIGGITHAILHLMYARFFSMVLRDLGLGAPSEPVSRLLCQGMVLKGGVAMSKSKGNVVAPDEVVAKFGADVTRLFVLFAAPPEKDLDWSEGGIEGLDRFARRVWRLTEAHAEAAGPASLPERGYRPENVAALALRRQAHETLARVTDDIDRRLHLNTAVSAIMELVNQFYLSAPPDEMAAGQPSKEDARSCHIPLPIIKEALEILAACLAPFAPHLAEEVWSRLGHVGLLATHAWPEPDPAMLSREEATVVVQVNGKMRGRVIVPCGASEAEVVAAIRQDARLAPGVFPEEGGQPPRTVFVPDRLLNVVHSR